MRTLNLIALVSLLLMSLSFSGCGKKDSAAATANAKASVPRASLNCDNSKCLD